VLAAFHPYYWLAQRIAGPSVAVGLVTAAGAEPHELELSPRQVAAVGRADLDNPACYAEPGAVPNGADYVRLRAADGPITGAALRSVEFAGDRKVPEPPPGALLFPFDAPNWFVRPGRIDPVHNRVLVRSFDRAATLSLDSSALAEFAAYPQVVAVVAHDDINDPNPANATAAPYRLTVNGVVQPGG
jgi:hypothetical protein